MESEKEDNATIADDDVDAAFDPDVDLSGETEALSDELEESRRLLERDNDNDGDSSIKESLGEMGKVVEPKDAITEDSAEVGEDARLRVVVDDEVEQDKGNADTQKV